MSENQERNRDLTLPDFSSNKKYTLIEHGRYVYKFKFIIGNVEEFNIDHVHANMRNIIQNLLWISKNMSMKELPGVILIATDAFNANVRIKLWPVSMEIQVHVRDVVLDPFPWQFEITVIPKEDDKMDKKAQGDGPWNLPPKNEPHTSFCNCGNSAMLEVSMEFRGNSKMPSEIEGRKPLGPCQGDAEVMQGSLKYLHENPGKFMFPDAKYLRWDVEMRKFQLNPDNSVNSSEVEEFEQVASFQFHPKELVDSCDAPGKILNLEQDFDISEDECSSDNVDVLSLDPEANACIEEPESTEGGILKKIFKGVKNLFS